MPVYMCRHNSLPKHQQKWPLACKIALSIPQLTSATKFKRITDVVRIELLRFGRLGLFLRASGAPGDVLRTRAPRRTRLAWRSRRENPGNKSVSLTRRLSSTDVPRHSHQFGTNKDVWEENRSCRSRCEGETQAGVWRSMSALKSLSEMICSLQCCSKKYAPSDL